MTTPAEAPVATASPPAVSATGAWLWHVLAAVLVVAGVLAQLLRPLAPAQGAVPDPSTAFDAAFLEQAAAYRRPVVLVAVVALLIRVAIAAAAAATPAGRRLVEAVIRRIGPARPARAAAVMVTTIVIATDLAVLPLAFWAGYVHDGRFGLRTSGLAGWSYDWLAVHAPVWIGVGVLTLAGYAVARRRPQTWAPAGGIAVGLAAGVLTFVSPLLLEPLLFRFEPLPDGPVRDEIELVLSSAGERVDAIMVADASRRTTRQNAYISGLGSSERVVLYDTLVSERPAREVAMVLAHELGHRRHADIPRLVALSVVGGILAAYLLDAVLRARVRRGRQSAPADPRAAAVVLLAVLVLNLASAPVQSLISRRAEAAADLASLQYTQDPETFVQMQRGLAVANLSDPLPPRPVTWWWGTHPPTMARIGMARWWEQR